MTGGRDDGRTPDTEPVRRFVYDRLMSDTKNPLIDLAVGADSFDLSDPDFWLLPRDVREGAFHALRQQPTLRYFDEWDFVDSPFPKGDGYFSLVRHEDVWFASRNPNLFISGKGSNIPDLPIEMAEFFGSMIAMDDPRHFRLRSIVSKGFTPKEITRVEGYVHEKAKKLVDGLLEKFPEGQCDFVTEIAAPLPLQIICEMMGIPEADEAQVFNWTNIILGAGDPEFGGDSMDAFMAAAIGMFTYAQALGEDRLAHPGDDLTSIMMNAEVDGERLTSQEFGSFFILLVVAGNETTRNAISHGMRALTLYPDQKKAWWDDMEGVNKTAVDEIVRWATPVIHFRRTATEDVVINNTKVEAGQKVVLWYNSANRDETVWTNPYEFDVRRPLQPQQAGFGAGGPHFCLGANLARREIAVAFDEIRRRLPNMQITGEPDYLQSNFINGIKHLPCSWK
jgi:cytochrome P450